MITVLLIEIGTAHMTSACFGTVQRGARLNLPLRPTGILGAMTETG
jgi:hypothetical protein